MASARTITEIYTALIDEKNNYTELLGLQPNIDDGNTLLTDLTSTSKVAVWRLLFHVQAVGQHIHELKFDEHTAEVTAIKESTPTNTARWISDTSKAFQLGDNLTYNSTNGRYEYSAITTSNQIVKLASVTEAGSLVVLKVAKLDSGGNPEPLTSSEFNSFNSYINLVKGAGQQITVRSDVADRLRVNINIYYDPLVLNPDGTLISNPASSPAEEALENYIQKQIPFDGIYRTSDLEQQVRNATGIRDASVQSDTYQFGVTTNPFNEIVDFVTPFAGYLSLDTTGSTITYINNETI